MDALRRGWPVTIDDRAYLAVETASPDGLASFDARDDADLLISGNRAATLKLTNQKEALPTQPVRVLRAPWIALDVATAVADPALDLASPLKGPFRAAEPAAPAADNAALRLARLAGLLPAFFTTAAVPEPAEMLASGAILRFGGGGDVRIVARARMPSAVSEQAEIIAFRADGDTVEPVALLIGAPTGEPPLVRVHSECLTGDVLGSLKCDCGPQLDAALDAIGQAGWGMLLYLRQEGRGIGLVNKLRAYALQDQGFDTVDANIRLGFADDERDFTMAAHMLRALGQERIRLLTNNPGKREALAAAGIEIAETVPLVTPAGKHNRAYLATKRDRSGHQL